MVFDNNAIVILWIPAARRLACSVLGFLWSNAIWPGWPQYLHRPSLFRRSFSSALRGPYLTDDTSIGPACVLIAVEGSVEIVVVTAAGATGANLVGWGMNLVVGWHVGLRVLTVLGVGRFRWLIIFMLESMLQSFLTRSARLVCFFLVTRRLLNSSLSFSYSRSRVWESSSLAFFASTRKVFKNTSRSLLAWYNLYSLCFAVPTGSTSPNWVSSNSSKAVISSRSIPLQETNGSICRKMSLSRQEIA